jgi:hypothetical protein
MSLVCRLDNNGDVIADKQEKNMLIDFIYSSIDISKFRYELLQYQSDLQRLQNQKYYLSANFTGKNCFLVFTTIRNKYYQYLVDRKTLSYNKNKNDISKIYLRNVNIRIDPSIYIGTIFDGIYTVSPKNNESFIITDIYYFMGKSYIDVPIDTKLFTIKEYLKSNLKQKESNKTLKVSINILHDVSKIKYFINNVLPLEQKNSGLIVKGICFYPETSGTKLIYLFDNENKTNENTPPIIRKIESGQTHNPMPNEDNGDEKISKYKYIPKIKETIMAILEIKSTDMPDIYKLYAVEKVTKNNKVMYKRKSMGIASIPSLQKSVWCKELLSKSSNVLVNCKYDTCKNKWEPLTQESIQNMPSHIQDIEKKMDIIEYSSDSA